MRKIITLFVRNTDMGGTVRDEITPGAEWVINGEGIATRKFDGTCCMVHEGKLYKRYDARAGKTPPAGFEAAQDPDPVTGHWPGWVLVGDGPEDRWHREAMALGVPKDGTYELIGPKIQGNPERRELHLLIKHGSVLLPTVPRDFYALRAYLLTRDIEGIVWHHPDGRMVKLKARDFGIRRKK